MAKDSKYFGQENNPVETLEQVQQAWQATMQKTSDSDRYDNALSNLSNIVLADEQYKRSLPESQLQHLIASGMSRAAAFAALQGSE